LSAFTNDLTHGRGFFTANSYPIDDSGIANNNAITTSQIPLYTSAKGNVFDLRDVVDFRPFASNTAAISNTVVGATANPANTLTFATNPYLPVPDSNFQTDLQYYLGRVDRAALDTGGNLILTEGIASVTPAAPLEKPGTMTLGLVSVPPYPSLDTTTAKSQGRYDYAISSSITQLRRYTMKDIGTLEHRIKNLEYYTSLSLLEQSAANLLVQSDLTGQNRFQNGFFVEPFKGFDLTNTIDPTFRAAIDPSRSEMRPAFIQMRSTLYFDAARSGNNVQKHGELIMLAHTSNNAYISQQFASK